MKVSMEALKEGFQRQGYICGEEILLPVYLSLLLEKPLLITGAPGVGKTELGRVLAGILDTRLLRLQCYEGLDEARALYEWNYHRQLLSIQMLKEGVWKDLQEEDIFSQDYLLPRPLLSALISPEKMVLLIDEIDKTDEEFEAFLLELLSDFQVSIPELGTVKATTIPVVLLTSNQRRELSLGLKRRCLFLPIQLPDQEKEREIIMTRLPEIPQQLVGKMVFILHHLRQKMNLKAVPSTAEALDWGQALLALNKKDLEMEVLEKTLTVFLKDEEDLQVVQEAIEKKEIVIPKGVL